MALHRSQARGHHPPLRGSRLSELTEPTRYKANDPGGKAFLKASPYLPPHETPDEAYPFWLSTGRRVFHFHTRTKTGRSRALNEAAPDATVYMYPEDAAALGLNPPCPSSVEPIDPK